MHHPLGDAASNQPLYSPTPAASDDHQVGLKPLGEKYYLLGGSTLPEVMPHDATPRDPRVPDLPSQQLSGFLSGLAGVVVEHQGRIRRGWYVSPDVNHVKLRPGLAGYVRRGPPRKRGVARAIGSKQDSR